MNQTTRAAVQQIQTHQVAASVVFSNLISNPTNMINNIEKVSQVVQSVSPVVEQYGPIMRNLPSIVKILTSGKSTEENPTEDQTEDVTEKVEVATPHPPSKKRKRKNGD